MAQISKKAKGTEKYFPPEILFEIVSRLPSKSIGRFTTVCKSWYSFIKSSAFIAAHLNQSIANNKRDDSSRHLLYIEPYAKDCYAYRDNTESFDDKVFHRKCPNDFDPKIWKIFILIGSCNGLVCLVDNELCGRVVYLWNPLIRKYKRITSTSSCCRTMLDDITHSQVSVGFWYDDGKHDYKLIRIMYNNSIEFAHRSQVELYSLSTGSWRKIDAKLPGRIKDDNVYNNAFLNGTLNWIADSGSGDFILSFDTSTEQFQKVELPEFRELHNGCWVGSTSLWVHKGCLALLVRFCGSGRGSDSWSLWVMNEFGVVESWVNKYTLVSKEALYRPIGVTQEDEIIFYCGKSVIAYDLETDMIRYLLNDSFVHNSWVNYTESLIFIDEENELFQS